MLPRARTARPEACPIHQRERAVDDLIPALIRERGMATVSGLTTREAIRAFALRVMTLMAHPDSDPDGLTTIRDIGPRAHRPGLAGLGRGGLAAHTERSSVPEPPRLMLLVCLAPAAAGGEVLLTDGQAVHQHLNAVAPDALEHLSRAGTAFYGDGGGIPTQIFTRHPGNRVSLRFRQDQLAQFSPLVERFLPDLKAAVTAHQRTIALSPGQGYIIDNQRYLHARAAFEGTRLHVRALGMPLFTLRPGFIADCNGKIR
ncbi:alpha-ketoglutarate-dependent taurine dioxygenase [Streptomyces sp. TE33382]